MNNQSAKFQMTETGYDIFCKYGHFAGDVTVYEDGWSMYNIEMESVTGQFHQRVSLCETETTALLEAIEFVNSIS